MNMPSLSITIIGSLIQGNSFYAYLKILKYSSLLLQHLYSHSVLNVIPTGYIQTLHFYGHYITNYWQPFEHYII